MRVSTQIWLAALVLLGGVSGPLSGHAAPLTDDTIPPESVVALGAPGSLLSFGADDPVLPVANPHEPVAPLPGPLTDPAAGSLLLPDEGDDAEAGADASGLPDEFDRVLSIDAGVAQVPELPPVGVD